MTRSVAFSSALYSQYQGFTDINMGRGSIVIGLAAVIIGEVLGDALFGKKMNFALRPQQSPYLPPCRCS